MTRAPVYLPQNVARCPSTRTQHCAQAGGCAKALVDGAGRAVEDYSTNARGPNGACLHFADAALCRKPAETIKIKVHESPDGFGRG